MRVIIIKLGSAGDVVRTSYIAERLYASGWEITWVTRDASAPLLANNPFINLLIPYSRHATMLPTLPIFDWAISLDDEETGCAMLKMLEYGRLTGAYLDTCNRVTYTEDSEPWFNMGLVSRLGKERADDLKKRNSRTHDEILSTILGLPSLRAALFVSGDAIRAASRALAPFSQASIGLNLSAGDRWPSKKLALSEAIELTRCLKTRGGFPLLLGGVSDLGYVESIHEATGCPILPPVSVEVFAALIGQLPVIITSDTLALHLAIAQRIPSISYYAPTSAAEINVFGLGEKVVSLADDYCSYRPITDISTLTAVRVLEAFDGLCNRLRL